MKRSNFLMFGIFALTLAATAGTALAQSGDRDNPIPLTSHELSGSLNPNNHETFYSFTAGPGELTITVDVQARHDDIGVLNFELLGRNASTALLCCEFAQGDGGGTGRDVKTIKLTKQQTVILHTTTGPVGGGTFRIRLTGGASASAGGSSAGGRSGSDRDDDGGRGNAGGEVLSVPSNGTLHIRMKNGTTQDIDLSLVRSVTVRP